MNTKMKENLRYGDMMREIKDYLVNSSFLVPKNKIKEEITNLFFDNSNTGKLFSFVEKEIENQNKTYLSIGNINIGIYKQTNKTYEDKREIEKLIHNNFPENYEAYAQDAEKTKLALKINKKIANFTDKLDCNLDFINKKYLFTTLTLNFTDDNLTSEPFKNYKGPCLVKGCKLCKKRKDGIPSLKLLKVSKELACYLAENRNWEPERKKLADEGKIEKRGVYDLFYDFIEKLKKVTGKDFEYYAVAELHKCQNKNHYEGGKKENGSHRTGGPIIEGEDKCINNWHFHIIIENPFSEEWIENHKEEHNKYPKCKQCQYYMAHFWRWGIIDARPIRDYKHFKSMKMQEGKNETILQYLKKYMSKFFRMAEDEKYRKAYGIGGRTKVYKLWETIKTVDETGKEVTRTIKSPEYKTYTYKIPSAKTAEGKLEGFKNRKNFERKYIEIYEKEEWEKVQKIKKGYIKDYVPPKIGTIRNYNYEGKEFVIETKHPEITEKELNEIIKELEKITKENTKLNLFEILDYIFKIANKSWIVSCNINKRCKPCIGLDNNWICPYKEDHKQNNYRLNFEFKGKNNEVYQEYIKNILENNIDLGSFMSYEDWIENQKNQENQEEKLKDLQNAKNNFNKILANQKEKSSELFLADAELQKEKSAFKTYYEYIRKEYPKLELIPQNKKQNIDEIEENNEKLQKLNTLFLNLITFINRINNLSEEEFIKKKHLLYTEDIKELVFFDYVFFCKWIYNEGYIYKIRDELKRTDKKSSSEISTEAQKRYGDE